MVMLSLGSPQRIAIEMLEDVVKKRNIKIKRILDVGCGDGSVLCILRQKNIVDETLCVEIDETSLSKVREKNITAYRVDVNCEKIPLPDSYVDAVLSLDVVEHIINLDNFFLEIKRVLKPNGILILSTPNIQFIYYIIRLILGHGPKTSWGDSVSYYGSDLYDHGHVHYFTANDLSKLLKKYNFEIIDIRGTYNVSRRFLSKIMKLASKRYILRYLCPGIVVKAKRKAQK